MNDLKDMKGALSLCRSKDWAEAVRLLDQSEVLGTPWGAVFTLQVMDYTTGEWIPCTVGGKTENSMAHLYRFIRSELQWEGPVRLAVAVE